MHVLLISEPKSTISERTPNSDSNETSSVDMSMHFSEEDARQLNARIRQLEKNTGIELVAVVVDKCDNYPEIPWKAFALGAALSALSILLPTLVRPDWLSTYSTLVHAMVILGAGTIMALLTVVWPGGAHLFLDKARAEGEMRQYAQAYFLENELFALPNRTGILLVIGLFEHQVVILPDSGVDGRLPAGALQTVMASMTSELKRGNRKRALSLGVGALEASLQTAGFAPPAEDTDRIPDALVQEKGGEDD